MAQDKAIITEVPFTFGKTKVFKVDSEKYRELLGTIKWSSNDFSYAYFTASHDASHNQTQLEQITRFVTRLNLDHRKA